VWLTDRSISKSFLCHHCVVFYTIYEFYVRAAQGRSQHVATRCTLRNSRPRLLPRLPLPIPTPLKLACSRLRPRCYCCCCCCRPAAVGTPYERRQNGWLHAETAGDCKLHLSFSMFDFFWRMFNPLRPVSSGAALSGLAISAPPNQLLDYKLCYGKN